MSETEAGGKAGHIVDEYGDPQRADVMRGQEYSGADVDLKDQKVASHSVAVDTETTGGV